MTAAVVNLDAKLPEVHKEPTPSPRVLQNRQAAPRRPWQKQGAPDKPTADPELLLSFDVILEDMKETAESLERHKGTRRRAGIIRRTMAVLDRARNAADPLAALSSHLEDLDLMRAELRDAIRNIADLYED